LRIAVRQNSGCLPRAGFWKLAAITVIVVAVVALVLFFRLTIETSKMFNDVLQA
jgi:hypothetical protein